MVDILDPVTEEDAAQAERLFQEWRHLEHELKALVASKSAEIARVKQRLASLLVGPTAPSEAAASSSLPFTPTLAVLNGGRALDDHREPVHPQMQSGAPGRVILERLVQRGGLTTFRDLVSAMPRVAGMNEAQHHERVRTGLKFLSRRHAYVARGSRGVWVITDAGRAALADVSEDVQRKEAL